MKHLETIVTTSCVQLAIIVLAIWMYSSMGGPAGPYLVFISFGTLVNLIAFLFMWEDFDK